MRGDHKKSVKLVQKLVSDSASGQHHEIVTLALLLQMLIHFDEGNFDLLDYLATGIKHLGKQQGLSETEKLILEMSGKLPRLHRVKNRKEFFSSYYNKFSALKKDRLEKHHFDYFDITSWLRQKMNRLAVN
jgi:hypothetical protein